MRWLDGIMFHCAEYEQTLGRNSEGQGSLASVHELITEQMNIYEKYCL